MGAISAKVWRLINLVEGVSCVDGYGNVQKQYLKCKLESVGIIYNFYYEMDGSS